MNSPEPDRLDPRDKYTGDRAKNYEANRTAESKWHAETRILTRICSELPKGSKILDVPCGTGRMYSIFKEFGHHAIGMDVSHEMASQAHEKGMTTRFGDIINLPCGSKTFDAAFCIRLLNWLSEDDIRTAIGELQRVTCKQITFTLRAANHPIARPISLIEESLSGWEIVMDEEIQGTFRMITLRPI